MSTTGWASNFYLKVATSLWPGAKSLRNVSPNSQAALSLIRMNRFLVCAVLCNKKADSLLRDLVGYAA
jgi:hypothetical protein